MTTVVLVGNPKPQSRTLAAAVAVAEGLTGRPPDVVIDLADLGPALLERDSQQVTAAVETVLAADLLVVASPTYKATYTGLLKLFLDQIGNGALAGTVAVPVMMGGDWRHSLAVEVHLKPLLSELGASLPTSGLFLLDAEALSSDVLTSWLARAEEQLR